MFFLNVGIIFQVGTKSKFFAAMKIINVFVFVMKIKSNDCIICILLSYN